MAETTRRSFFGRLAAAISATVAALVGGLRPVVATGPRDTASLEDAAMDRLLAAIRAGDLSEDDLVEAIHREMPEVRRVSAPEAKCIEARTGLRHVGGGVFRVPRTGLNPVDVDDVIGHSIDVIHRQALRKAGLG